MKEIIQSYSLYVDETHIQIGEVSMYTRTHKHTRTDIPVGGVGVSLTWGCAHWVHCASYQLVSSLISLII